MKILDWIKNLFKVDIYDIIIGPCFGGEDLTEEDIEYLQEKINKMREKKKSEK